MHCADAELNLSEVASLSRSRCATATKLGRLVCPYGSRMSKVLYGVSVPSFPVKVSPEER
ncbi:hypothetical protein DPMN_072419 [Dreissena polymorpha]|uniref:Uncharacterized protein n=1 Tax=Dreissena polymorpha TaxID=45954 RepID=A0A9D4BQF9_DREPO|nr:hypothetical protein DPMN_072419 [Dreissena polymorpha]